MSPYLAFLDRHHLENTIFLTAFAKSLAKQGNRRGIIIHGDSEYTERLIQTGMMREDAQIRAAKDLNRRLVGLFADNGVSTIGIHGFQKGLVTKTENGLLLNKKKLQSIHSTPCLLISNLAEEKEETISVNLPELARLFSDTFEDAEVVLFSKNERDEILTSSGVKDVSWEEISSDFEKNTLPEEFINFNYPAVLTTATDFANWPNLKKMTKIS
ncbi:MAG: hypothetical protein WD016_04930 [Balneolaceae bacterium]